MFTAVPAIVHPLTRCSFQPGQDRSTLQLPGHLSAAPSFPVNVLENFELTKRMMGQQLYLFVERSHCSSH